MQQYGMGITQIPRQFTRQTQHLPNQVLSPTVRVYRDRNGPAASLLVGKPARWLDLQ